LATSFGPVTAPHSKDISAIPLQSLSGSPLLHPKGGVSFHPMQTDFLSMLPVGSSSGKQPGYAQAPSYHLASSPPRLHHHMGRLHWVSLPAWEANTKSKDRIYYNFKPLGRVVCFLIYFFFTTESTHFYDFQFTMQC